MSLIVCKFHWLVNMTSATHLVLTDSLKKVYNCSWADLSRNSRRSSLPIIFIFTFYVYVYDTVDTTLKGETPILGLMHLMVNTALNAVASLRVQLITRLRSYLQTWLSLHYDHFRNRIWFVSKFAFTEATELASKSISIIESSSCSSILLS